MFFFFAGPWSRLIIRPSCLRFSRLSSPWRPLKAVATECRSSIRVRPEPETIPLKFPES